MRVDFTYHHLGATYEVAAIFTPGLYRASMSGPYDDEPTLDDIEVIGPDGMDWAGEMKDVFTRRHGTGLKVEMVSILDLIEEEAFDKLQVAA